MPMFTQVAPEPARAPVSGLVATAGAATQVTDQWQNGVSWRPERCFDSQGFPQCGITPDGVLVVGGGSSGPVYYYPPAFRVVDQCASSAGPLDTARLRRQIEAATSFWVARELWTGALSDADPFTNPVGDTNQVNPRLAAAAAEVVPGVHNPVTAIALLEQAAREVSHGQDPWLHMTVAAANIASAGGMLTRQPGTNRLVTVTGAVIVADGGYTGAGPTDPADANRTWMYATGPVAVRLGSILLDESQATILNRSINRYEAVGYRPFAALFDPCMHLAIQAAYPDPIT